MFKPHTINRENPLLSSFLGFVFVILLVLTIYFPTLSYDFTNWDDPSYIQEVQSIKTPGWSGIREILTKPIPVSHGDYIPVTILSYWIDYQLWRFRPTGYHLTNLLLHALSTGLLFLLLQRLTLRPTLSIIVALLFALHPMNTEAVTWIAERKSVMAMLWMLLSFHAFISWQRSSAEKRKYLYLSLLCYVLACLSKTAVVFFPLLLMAYQVCLAGIGLHRSIVSVMSFFLISVVTGIGRLIGHYASGQMIWEPFETPWVQVITIFEIFGSYVRKLVVPISLNNSYSLETYSSLFEPGVFFGILSMLGMVILIVKCMRTYPLVSFGLAWYLAAWLPHAQIIAIPPALRADRYVYYSSTGLFLSIVFGIEQWIINTKYLFNSKQLRVAICALGFIIVSLFASMTVFRNNVWSNSISLWCDSVKKDCQNTLAHTNLGKAYEKEGMLDEAISEHKKVLAIKPNYAIAYYNLGGVYARQGRLDKAISEYKQSLAINPNSAETHTDLGNAYFKEGKLDEAIFEHEQSLAINPNYAKAYINLGVAYGGKGRLDKAISAFKKALDINPNLANAHNNIAVAYYYRGNYKLAMDHYDKAQEHGFGVNQQLLALLEPYR